MTRLPLYSNHGIGNPLSFKSANPGMLFERFYCDYKKNWEIDKDVTENNTGFLTNFPRNVGEKGTLDRYRYNTLSLVEVLKGEYWAMKSQWHFVTGLGIDHPLENGLLWHHVLGTPYLPGSSLKGLARAWLELHNYDKEIINRAFGHETGDLTLSSGEAIFLDALPMNKVKLCIDTATPHMDKWYSDGASNPNKAETLPADWHSPVPAHFLAAENIELLFAVAPRIPTAENRVKKEVRTAHEAALRHLGAGAKTSAGYGTFSDPDQSTMDKLAESQEDVKLQSMSESARIVEEVRKDVAWKGNQNQGNPFHTNLDNYLEQSKQWPKEDRMALADLAYDFFIRKNYGQKKLASKRKRLIKELKELD